MKYILEFLIKMAIALPLLIGGAYITTISHAKYFDCKLCLLIIIALLFVDVYSYFDKKYNFYDWKEGK